ncbi:glycine cleavage system protein R [Ningiella sp. W23]|uniref:glycine cleavage system protein R n=1 Tax=Ningiella sp. W23 TaxID=3023715 RepID=UPI0039F5F255
MIVESNKKVVYMQAMVLSVVGKDRPGLVEDIAKCVNKADGNWLKSSFCHLSGHFAGFVEVMLPSAQHNALVQACHALSSLQITLMPASVESQQDAQELVMTLTANDRKGIINDISHCLASLNINITEMETTCESAPNWGNQIFSAKIKLAAPPSLSSDDVKESIEQITDDLVVEFSAS